ncbi:MAG: hypothetical protein DWQ02_00705 [Bacteroidetes bacterium]|nr:MAG: hypothetical protein DWQ02_00705 [Bacteroidota bacterium]
MAGLMLTTTFNLAIDMHYCKGELKSVALFSKAKSCHSAEKKKSCPNHPPKPQSDTAEKKNCCQNRGLLINADIDEQVLAQDLTPPGKDFQPDSPVIFSFCPTTLLAVWERPVHKEYKPPLIQKDIPVLFESYLL